MVRKLGKGKDTYTEKQNIMREPFMDEFPEHLQRLRRNLLVTGTACFVYKMSGVTLSANGSFFGIKYDGLKTPAIEWVLVAVVVYLFAHFIWAAVEQFHQWRLRLTGTKDQIMDDNGDVGPYPENVTQYTLYNWWLDESRYFNSQIHWLQETEGLLSEVRALKQSKDGVKMISPTMVKNLAQAVQKIQRMSDQPDRRIITARQEFEGSLKAFDAKFWRYQKSRVLRFFLIEYSLPIIAGGLGVGTLLLARI